MSVFDVTLVDRGSGAVLGVARVSNAEHRQDAAEAALRVPLPASADPVVSAVDEPDMASPEPTWRLDAALGQTDAHPAFETSDDQDATIAEAAVILLNELVHLVREVRDELSALRRLRGLRAQAEDLTAEDAETAEEEGAGSGG